ncbi:MAG TPA: EipA family protein [Hyphomicrobium sp.]|nr:EipA family protein [Hyphomicrobium sp.]
MKLRRLRPALLGLALALAMAPAAPAAAQTCSAESFGEAVDASAAELRAFSAETQPKLKQKLAALRDTKKWADADYETQGLALVHDKKLDGFDSHAGELLTKIDTLGSPEATDAAATSCTNLDELKAASSELMAVMRAKSAYLISKLDREIASGPAAKPAEVATAEPAPAPATDRLTAFAPGEKSSDLPAANPDEALSPLRRGESAPKAEPAPKPEPIQKSEPAPKAEAHPEPAPPPPAAEAKPHEGAPHEGDKTSSWSTTTAQAVIPPPALPRPRDDAPAAYETPAPGDPPGVPYELPPSAGPDDEASTFDAEGGGYSIDEIREATRGFFGTVSTSLASVIEHAFQKAGRPTAYVLGTEGGGAFLAGLRYGEGTLYLRSGGSQKVYWHGPSLGYDLGAEGSRTLVLIYSLDHTDSLFRRFTGVDGSAYLVGGVGMTLLKGGPVTMAPIRSGLGLRIGANIGYLRFTPRPTWNPF